jgi:predicted MFS family arabinose efflux permease
MTAREITGLALLGAAVIAAPMAYFVGGLWGWAALCLALVGLPLFLTRRVTKRWGKSPSSGPDVGGELMGFPGRRVFRHSDQPGSADDE